MHIFDRFHFQYGTRLLFTIVVWATTYFFGARFRIVMGFRKKHCYKFNDFEKNAKIRPKKQTNKETNLARFLYMPHIGSRKKMQ